MNIWIWGWSPLGSTTNIGLASVAVAAMGLFFISFPRYYVELMWRDYQIRVEKKDWRLDPMDIRRRARDRTIVGLVDAVFISTFVLNYVGLKTVGRGDAIEAVLKVLGIMN